MTDEIGYMGLRSREWKIFLPKIFTP